MLGISASEFYLAIMSAVLYTFRLLQQRTDETQITSPAHFLRQSRIFHSGFLRQRPFITHFPLRSPSRGADTDNERRARVNSSAVSMDGFSPSPPTGTSPPVPVTALLSPSPPATSPPMPGIGMGTNRRLLLHATGGRVDDTFGEDLDFRCWYWGRYKHTYKHTNVF